jgi:hypothetical protein
MGLGSWIAAGIVAFALARLLALRSSRAWLEIATSVLVALLFGIAATILDFGGWQELEWRAAIFAFLGAATSIALLRLIALRHESPAR